MALGDDYNTGQPDNTGDSDVQRKKSALELILRAQQKPSISPVMTQNQPSQGAASGRTSVLGNQRSAMPEEETAGAHKVSMMTPAGSDAPSLLKQPTVSGQPSGTGTTPTLATGAENPTAQPNYRPSSAPVRLNVPAPRATDTTAPDINANAPFTPPQSSGKRLLGMGGQPSDGMPLLGRGPQPTRPDVMPTRADFPQKPIPTWEKVLGVAAAPFAPAVTGAIFTGPRRAAERQYEGAVKDWQMGQEGQERQARIEETQARTRSLNNPQPKEGVTPEETTLQDLMTGNNGQPQINPDTGKPYTRLEAYRTVQTAKIGAAEGAKQPPLGPADIEQINQMHGQRYQTLNPGKPLPPAFTLRPGSTQADYDRIDKNLTQMESAQGTQAQRDFNRGQQLDAAARRNQDREDKREEKYGAPVYAYDPDKKQTILTTQGAATKNNLQAVRKVTQPDIEKDTDKLRQIGDAQMNVSAYRVSLQGMNALSGNDLARVGALIGDDKFKLHFMGMEIPVDWYNQLRDNQKFNDLPEDAKDAVVGYIGARGSIIAYTKAISGTGRLTETQLQTEMQNLPKPTDPQDVAEKKFARFQRNIDQAASGLPKIPGIDTPAEIRAKTEVSKPQMPTQAQPQAAAPKPLKKRLVDFLNQKMGAE